MAEPQAATCPQLWLHTPALPTPSHEHQGKNAHGRHLWHWPRLSKECSLRARSQSSSMARPRWPRGRPSVEHGLAGSKTFSEPHAVLHIVR